MQEFKHFIDTHLPRRSSRRGFVTGLTLAVLATVGVISASHFASADSFPGSSNTTTAETSTVSDGSFGGQPDITPAPASSAATPATGSTPVTAAGTPNQSYVALGDSVAAGLGLPLVANPTAQDTSCGRSTQAYGYEVGRQLGRTTTILACSGATAGDLNTQQRIAGGNPQSQLSAAFANGTPALISITAGANDSYWQRFIQKCYTTTCGGRLDTGVVNNALVLMQAKYKVAMENIRLRSAANDTNPPTVVLTGYYNPLSQACLNVPDLQNRLTQAELTWLEGSVNALNKTISDMATSYDSFARYAAVDFAGHDVCSGNSWIQGLGDTAPIHPTEAGQQAIANAVVQAARR